MRAITYKVVLTEEEQELLKIMIQKKEEKGYRIRRAKILLELNHCQRNNLTYKDIQQIVGVTSPTIVSVAKRFTEGGLKGALDRKYMASKYLKVTKEVEEQICRIAQSQPPEGRLRWVNKIIAQELVKLGIVDSLSQSTVSKVLKKYGISLRTDNRTNVTGYND